MSQNGFFDFWTPIFNTFYHLCGVRISAGPFGRDSFDCEFGVVGRAIFNYFEGLLAGFRLAGLESIRLADFCLAGLGVTCLAGLLLFFAFCLIQRGFFAFNTWQFRAASDFSIDTEAVVTTIKKRHYKLFGQLKGCCHSVQLDFFLFLQAFFGASS